MACPSHRLPAGFSHHFLQLQRFFYATGCHLLLVPSFSSPSLLSLLSDPKAQRLPALCALWTVATVCGGEAVWTSPPPSSRVLLQYQPGLHPWAQTTPLRRAAPSAHSTQSGYLKLGLRELLAWVIPPRPGTRRALDSQSTGQLPLVFSSFGFGWWRATENQLKGTSLSFRAEQSHSYLCYTATLTAGHTSCSLPSWAENFQGSFQFQST